MFGGSGLTIGLPLLQVNGFDLGGFRVSSARRGDEESCSFPLRLRSGAAGVSVTLDTEDVVQMGEGIRGRGG